MTLDQLAVTSRSRGEACHATVRLLDNIHFECRFQYPGRKIQPENLSDRLAGQFGLEWSRHRVTVGDVEFMFSRYHGEKDYRLDEISLYTNPDLWMKADLTVPTSDLRDVYFEFDLPGQKVDTISLSAELEIQCDPNKQIVVFDFAKSQPGADWARIAGTVFVSQTENGTLNSLVFETVAS